MDRVDDLTGVTAHNHSMQEADIMGAASEGGNYGHGHCRNAHDGRGRLVAAALVFLLDT